MLAGVAAWTSSRKQPLHLEGSSCVKKGKQHESKETFDKWQPLYEREDQSMMWLRCDVIKLNKTLVSTLWCEV